MKNPHNDPLFHEIVEKSKNFLTTNYARGKLEDIGFRGVVAHNLVAFIWNDISKHYDLVPKKKAGV